MQLHSCDVDVLERGEVIEVLQQAKQAGKTRFIGYSGDNEAALWAVESGLFDTLQTSFNVVDQNARLYLFGPAKARGMGVICKRPIANGAWGAAKAPSDYAAEYFTRAQKMLALGRSSARRRTASLLALDFASRPRTSGRLHRRHAQSQASPGQHDMVNTQLPIAPEAVAEIQRRFEPLADGLDWSQRE